MLFLISATFFYQMYLLEDSVRFINDNIYSTLIWRYKIKSDPKLSSAEFCNYKQSYQKKLFKKNIYINCKLKIKRYRFNRLIDICKSNFRSYYNKRFVISNICQLNLLDYKLQINKLIFKIKT